MNDLLVDALVSYFPHRVYLRSTAGYLVMEKWCADNCGRAACYHFANERFAYKWGEWDRLSDRAPGIGITFAFKDPNHAVEFKLRFG